MPKTKANTHLKLPDAERERLKQRIIDDLQRASQDHKTRMARFGQYYRAWRARTDPKPAKDKRKPNFRVPLTQWHIYARLAKEIAALFGKDAEIVVEPVGPSDSKVVKKIALYMNWRVFKSMKLVKPFIEFVLRKIIFGRSIAYCPWVRETYTLPSRWPKFLAKLIEKIIKNAGGREVVHYEGPGFTPLWPDDIVVPAERARTIHEFSFVVRKYNEALNPLLGGQGTIYEEFSPDLKQRLVTLAHEDHNASEDESDGREVEVQLADGEGVIYDNAPSARDGVRVYEWYGRWHMLKGKQQDVDVNDMSGREALQTDLVVRYCPRLREILGVQDLAEQYPLRKDRRPFVETSMLSDGAYWSAGFAEMLKEPEAELTATQNLGVEAGQYSVGPVIFAKPAAGTDAEVVRYAPFTIYPSDNPQQDVHVVNMRPDFSFVTIYSQAVMSFAERVTGQGDLQLGRSGDRPTSPRTVGQTVALLDEGNVRIELDTQVLRADMAEILAHFWSLDTTFSPGEQFFRVTEEEAGPHFAVTGGGAKLLRAEREGEFDFDIKFATSAINKQIERDRAVQLYDASMQNPIVAANPNALWKVTNRLFEAFGQFNFRELVPEPPEPDRPLRPSEEHVMLAQGEEIHVNPLDADQQHLVEHRAKYERALEEHRAQTEAGSLPDPTFLEVLSAHYQEHIAQIREKKLMAELVRQVGQNVEPLLRGAGQLQDIAPGGEQTSDGVRGPQVEQPVG